MCFTRLVEKLPCKLNHGTGARWTRSYKRAVANEFIPMRRRRLKEKAVKRLCDKLQQDVKKWIQYSGDRYEVR